MVDFLTLLQQTFRKFALKAEIALVLDREIANRQRKFGVDLYDLIEKQRTTVKQQINDELQKKEENGNQDDKEKREGTTAKEQADTVDKNVQQLLQVFQTIENEIRLPLEATQKEIDDMQLSKPAFPPIFIQRRKEEFGITIWPMISDSTMSLPETLEKEFQKTENASSTGTTPAALDFMNKAVQGLVKGTKATLKKAVGSLSPAEREVEACVDVAKQDMQLLEAKKLVKTKELEQLVDSGTTLECF
mmetsp:Transcript_11267/g.12759  ORF Transcript_11267/g.12759 Transcript_11267/m.12759 type:complete len:247 (+) Transcript_11267:37-777(+)